MELHQYASSVRSTKGYYILYEDKSLVVSTSDKDPDLIISTKKRFGPGLQHVRIKKEKIVFSP